VVAPVAELLEPIAVELPGALVVGGLRDCADAAMEIERIAVNAKMLASLKLSLTIVIRTIAD
jgi:hypothetical protein